MHYYNEYDPKAAAWLRELIKEGLIPDGYVDERSITEVTPAILSKYTQCHFFAGIGGWPRALRIAGWPDDRPVWTGSCPCQPFSVAGQGAGSNDERHLWPAFRWLIAQCRPPVCFGEQVASKAGRAWLSGVQADLEALGYRRAGADLCAAGIGAPHLRQRLWWVGDRDTLADTQCERRGGRSEGPDVPQIQRRESSEVQAPGLRTSGGLADANSERWSQGEPNSQARSGLSGHGLESGGLADSNGRGPQGRLAGDAPPDGGGGPGRKAGAQACETPGDHSTAGGLADTESERRDGAPTAPEQTRWGLAQEGGPLYAACRDGKLRRIPTEPELFPLADGVPNRVGLLRGAGNAIVPYLAAQFIGAYCETDH